MSIATPSPADINDPTPAMRTLLVFSEFLERFDDVREERDGYVAICPGHPDSNPSLRVTYNPETKKIGLHCRAGCKTPAVVAALDMSMSDLFNVIPGDITDLRSVGRQSQEPSTGDRAALAMYSSRTQAAFADDGADAVKYALTRFGIDEAQALELGLGYDDGSVDTGQLTLSRRRYRNTPRLVVPFNGFDGKPRGLQARAIIDGAEPRWSGPNNPEGATWSKFGVFRADGGREEFLVCEGPGDALTATAAGFDAICIRGAALGNNAALADELAAGLAGHRVIVAGDADTAGKTFTGDVVSALAARGIDVHRLTLPDGVGDLADWYSATGDAFPAVLAEAVADAVAVGSEGTGTGTGTEGADEKAADGEPRVSADAVVNWAENKYRLGRSTDGILFAVPTYEGSNRIAREVRSIRNDVLRRYREDRKRRTGRGVVIGRDTLSSALDLLAALAEDAQEHPEPVAIRSAQVGDDRVVLDHGTADGRATEVTASGWVTVPPSAQLPLFRRSNATQPLRDPEPGGSMDALRELLGLRADDRQWLLIRGWLVASLFSEVPRPLLWVTGPQGSGKSTRARMALSLIEPTDSLGKEPGRNERDDSTAARGRYLVSYDNITSVSQTTSDWLCRLVTGVTDDRRALYSDDDLRPVSFRRSGVATSITLPPGLGSDALERIVLVPLDRVPDEERRGEAGLWAAYEAAKPRLLGALLDDVVLVLRHLEAVKQEARSRPRMADYADILRALDRGLGLDEDAGHLAAYVGTVDESLADRALATLGR